MGNAISMFTNSMLIVWDDLLKSGEIFWKGMVAMLIVIAAVFLITLILNKSSDKMATKKEKEAQTKTEDTDINKDDK